MTVIAADAAVVSELLRRQRTHPPLEGLPQAAQVSGLPLYIGEARAAEDADFLEAQGISAVVSLGTGPLAPKSCAVLLVDILDMEEELLLPHFARCIAFLQKHLAVKGTATLVHCVYGQSRSAAVCVAYLMASQRMGFVEAYDTMQHARPCIAINAGFLRQLALFQRMQTNPDVLGDTPAHAELRTMMACQQRQRTGTAEVVATAQLARPGSSLSCRKCHYVLCTTRNQVSHDDPSGQVCAGVFIEPMHWMKSDAAFSSSNEGKLLCPSCRAKLGSWKWIGVKCQCKRFVSPAFQLVPGRIQLRAL